MLNKEEEDKLNMFFRIIEAAKEQNKFSQLGFYDTEWLITKLKEVNDELIMTKEVYEELSDAFTNLKDDYNILQTRLGYPERTSVEELTKSAVYNNPKNEISDRFEPR